MHKPGFIALPAREACTDAECIQCAAAFADTMARRRTVRDFSDLPVPRALIEHALRAAGTAPSGANQQPWRFVAIADAGWTRQAIEARLGKLTPNSGSDEDQIERELWSLEFEPAGAAKPERVHIAFRRPLQGADLIRRLGIEEPRITAGDTHMQSRGVIDLKHRLSLETGYPLPARGGYALDIEVSREGLIETKEEYPASTVWRTDDPQILWLTALAPVKAAE